MKYVSFQVADDEPIRLGILNPQGDAVAEVAAALERTGNPVPNWSHRMIDCLQAGPEATEIISRLVQQGDDLPWQPLNAVKLLAPLPRPNTLRDCLSFERHWIQCARTVASWKFKPMSWVDRKWESLTGRSLLTPPKVYRERPIYYKGNPCSVVGDGAVIRWPAYSERLDFELEIAVYIGREGVNLSRDTALDHVAGFSLFNDMSARDVQFREMQGRLGPSKSKDFDTGNVLGPFLATPDEVELNTLNAKVTVNGETWAESQADTLQHDVADTVAFLSQSETLYPGDVIGLGTLPNGCGLELNRWIQPGDVIELSAEGLGKLTNRVVR